MEITEVRIKLVENARERLRAFCSITLDGAFVIRDLKIIDGTNGVFVAMPSRKLMDRCPRCGSKNHLRSRFCNDCGAQLNENRAPKDVQGRAKLHADVAHPINATCREQVQKAVVEAYQAEQEKAKSPDYKPAKFDDFDDYEDMPEEPAAATPVAEAAPPPPPKPAREPRPQPKEVPAAPVADARAGERKKESGDHFGDYNSLIADLKRDAQSRRQPNGRGADADDPITADQPPKNRHLDMRPRRPSAARPGPTVAPRSRPHREPRPFLLLPRRQTSRTHSAQGFESPDPRYRVRSAESSRATHVSRWCPRSGRLKSGREESRGIPRISGCRSAPPYHCGRRLWCRLVRTPCGLHVNHPFLVEPQRINRQEASPADLLAVLLVIDHPEFCRPGR